MNRHYLHRELGDVAFNERVLSLATDPHIPLLERLNFITICSLNLDEFFSIKVARLKRQLESYSEHSEERACLEQLLKDISLKTHQLIEKQYQLLNIEILPALAHQGIEFISRDQWDQKQYQILSHYFTKNVQPLLTPIALDTAHPLPRLRNQGLNFIISLSGNDPFGRDIHMAALHVPQCIPRLLSMPYGNTDQFVKLVTIIEAHMYKLFPGMEILSAYQFRLTRDSELSLHDNPEGDLPNLLKSQLVAQRFGQTVRLEIDDTCPQHMIDFLLHKHALSDLDLYRIPGPINLGRYRILLEKLEHPELRFKTLKTKTLHITHSRLNIFSQLQQHDILLHHPKDHFGSILDILQSATQDPHVLAIKATVYRTGKDSPFIKALIAAARAGKEVTAVIELRARFDEAENIELASQLQSAGALIAYGILDYKIHAKLLMIVRQEDHELKRYVHLGTGNYHAGNASRYTDFGLITQHEGIAHDVQSLFQQLTGSGKTKKLKCLWQSPFTMKTNLLEHIQFEIQEAQAQRPSRIMIKVNHLTDKDLIDALYSASQNRVQITLIVRGTCTLIPKKKSLSENIQVFSALGRFLEHERLYYFFHAGAEKTFLSSADWMERNLHQRVEVACPIFDPLLKARILEEGFYACLPPRNHLWELDEHGVYHPINPS